MFSISFAQETFQVPINLQSMCILSDPRGEDESQPRQETQKKAEMD
jgi:hypothetical protein